MEAHHLTEKNSRFIENITYDELMGLSATVPEKGSDKADLLNTIAPVVFSYTLDEAREDDVSADYEIYVVDMPLNDVSKIIPAGTQKKRFYVTEKKGYEYLNHWFIQTLMGDKDNKEELTNMIIRKRTDYIYNLPSKAIVAKFIMNKILDSERTIIFGSTKKQIETLCGLENVYHSGTDNTALDNFSKGDTKVLGAVRALDEAVNLPNIDQIFIVQLTSKVRQTIQRIGRVIRKRPGHVAKIYILVVSGTVDEEWSKKALVGFDSNKMHYISYKNFLP